MSNDTTSPSAVPPGLPPVDSTPAPKRSQGGPLVFLVLVGVLFGAGAVILLKSSAPADTASASMTGSSNAATPVPGPVASDATTAVASAPKWTGGVTRSRGRSVAAYELDATNDVAVWGKVVRPVLIARCLEGTTEVFVLTQSAAALEGNDGTHTVNVGYDAEADAHEQWLASQDYDALFAQNGVAAARRIAAARTMRFGFTPFNSAHVVARFDVAGFDAMIGTLAKTCRWK